jgi:hypothetical protein
MLYERTSALANLIAISTALKYAVEVEVIENVLSRNGVRPACCVAAEPLRPAAFLQRVKYPEQRR